MIEIGDEVYYMSDNDPIGPVKVIGRVLDCSCMQVYKDHKGCLVLEDDLDHYHGEHTVFRTALEAVTRSLKDARWAYKHLREEYEKTEEQQQWLEFLLTKPKLKDRKAKRVEIEAARKAKRPFLLTWDYVYKTLSGKNDD